MGSGIGTPRSGARKANKHRSYKKRNKLDKFLFPKIGHAVKVANETIAGFYYDYSIFIGFCYYDLLQCHSAIILLFYFWVQCYFCFTFHSLSLDEKVMK